MTSYTPTNTAQVHTALARIAADVVVEGLPLPELPGAHRGRSAKPTRMAPRLAPGCWASWRGGPGRADTSIL